MNLIEQLTLGLQACRYTAREWFRLALWAPFALLFAAQLALLAILMLWAHPALSWALAPLVGRMAGPAALHYPEYFRHLPGLVWKLRGLADVLVGPLAFGLATRLFAWRWRGQPQLWTDAWRAVLPRWGALVGVSLPPFLVLTVLTYLGEHLVALRLSPLGRAAMPGLLNVCGALIQVAWAYAVALIVLDRRGVMDAIRELPHTWVHGALPAVVVLALAALLQWPGGWLVERTGVVVDRGLPDLVALIVAARLVFALFGAFLVTGAVTLVWTSTLWRAEGDQ